MTNRLGQTFGLDVLLGLVRGVFLGANLLLHGGSGAPWKNTLHPQMGFLEGK
jgi:hypothetical protein